MKVPDNPLVPVVAVHLIVLWEPVCHICGWSGGIFESVKEADRIADTHDCLPY